MRARIRSFAVSAVLAVSAFAGPALAVVPGGNGRIAFTSNLGGDRDVSSS